MELSGTVIVREHSENAEILHAEPDASFR